MMGACPPDSLDLPRPPVQITQIQVSFSEVYKKYMEDLYPELGLTLNALNNLILCLEKVSQKARKNRQIQI